MKLLVFVLLVLLAACTLPDSVTTVTPEPTATATLTATASATPTASHTPTPSATFTATPTADSLVLSYPETITVTPWSADNPNRMIRCLLAYFDLTWMPGRITVYRRDKGGYFNCIAGGGNGR